MFGRSKKEKSMQNTSASQNTSAKNCGGRCSRTSNTQSLKNNSNSTRNTTRNCN